MKALVIGGTGPTGPFVVNGLLTRGYQVTIYHRGIHEVEFSGPVEHLHGDPFSWDELERDLAASRFDLVVSNYGRLRYIAEVLAGHTQRLIGITGGRAYLGYVDPTHNLEGMPLPIPEDAPVHANRDLDKFSFAVAETERQLITAHQRGDFRVTILRYPRVYGPGELVPDMWPIVKRALDHRPYIVVPGNSLCIRNIGYAENVAHAVLLAIDQPQSAGQIYNVADERYLTLKTKVNLIAKILGHQWEVVEAQHPWAEAIASSYARPPFHSMFDITKIRAELGYQDVVPTAEAVQRTVTWLVENHHSVINKGVEGLLGDSYDYAFEDRFITAYREHMDALSASLPPIPPPPSYEYAYKG